MKKLLLSIITVLLLATGASAQSDSLGVVAISADYPQCPDTAYGNQPYMNIQVTIHNYNPINAFTGTLFIFLQTDTVFPPDSISLNAGSAFTILPNSDLTVAYQSAYFFNPANYKLGSNVIVVWPVGGPGTGTFSYNPYYTCVFFQMSSGINEETENAISITPNPANDYLEIKTPSNNYVKDVRILDATGRLMMDKNGDVGTIIPIEKLNKGVYLLQLQLMDDKLIYRRFVKQ